MKHVSFPVTFLAALFSLAPTSLSQKSFCSESASSIGKAIADKAESYVGSTDWAYASKVKRFGANTYKCNIFVAEMIESAGGQFLIIMNQLGILSMQKNGRIHNHHT